MNAKPQTSGECRSEGNYVGQRLGHSEIGVGLDWLGLAWFGLAWLACSSHGRSLGKPLGLGLLP